MKKDKDAVVLIAPARSPLGFKPPIVRRSSEGMRAFHAYDWYFNFMRRKLAGVKKVFLTPCAATKPIHTSPLHRNIYQKYAAALGRGREILVVSEPVVLIYYPDLSERELLFCYDFPPRLLSEKSRTFFVERLKILLEGKSVVGCLPRHHASLITDAVGPRWTNYWQGDLYGMMKKATALGVHPVPMR